MVRRTEAWGDFLEYLKQAKIDALLEMAQAPSWDYILRLQGVVQVLDELLRYPDDLEGRLAGAMEEAKNDTRE